MPSLLTALLKFATRSLIFAVVLWIGLIYVAEANGGDVEGQLLLRGVSEQRVFDYFKLALQWPGTYCRKTSKCCAQNGCCRGSNSPTGFTIHGLWADYNDGTWPSCCSGKKFDATQIATLRNALYKYWPTLSCSDSKNCYGGKGLFWEHEVEKHGTCAASVTGDEYNYFVTTLNLYFKYNVTEFLADEGYVASNSEKYPVGGIISAIQNAFQATPEVECSGDALEEIYLCFDKTFKPRDCEIKTTTNSGIVTSSTCPSYVSLPVLASSKLGHSQTGVSQSTLQSSI
ncbi:ribonuclease 2-like [Salvia miltiorrhiza]|uniref:ribonuclease 2-like n=1 Tax=Salvia miltiorrhiza TaxID=226208 RepID=UPI0025ABE77A|nr:ribonuclease 2-like [Salvia miltiorrhiza]